MNLSIDLETYSSVDLKKSGLYKYVQSADFEIMLLAYAFDDEEVHIVDIKQGEAIPQALQTALFDRNVVKRAYNAPFEWQCLCKHFNIAEPMGWLAQWQCTMHKGLYLGLPAGLGAISEALELPVEHAKSSVGKSLIKRFCVPCAPTARNGNRTRILPHHEPDQWKLFKEYCVQDVVAEREVCRQLADYSIPYEENYLWQLDQLMNCTGVQVDTELMQSAIEMYDVVKSELTSKAKAITNLDNPNSAPQLLEWLRKSGLDLPDLKKETVQEALKREGLPQVVREVLRLRKELSRTSIKKYHAMEYAVCDDGRVRGMLQFYGANRTGRWAGRFVQVHNLPRNYLSTLDTARRYLKSGNLDAIKVLYDNPLDVMSQLIRTTFVPRNGCKYAVADFSAIEARVLSWLADERWRLDVFNTHGKIYEASASAMFSVPLERIAKGNPEYELRQKGKVAELALGYQGSSNALVQMGALNGGLTEQELPDIVKRWRTANKRIVSYWASVGEAALRAVRDGQVTTLPYGVTFSRDNKNLIITLPSGRQLFYAAPFLSTNQFGNDAVYYYGVEKGKWSVQSTYGGKLTENIVQAVARDCLANSLINLYKRGYVVVMHVHDECVIELPSQMAGELSLQDAIKTMCELPTWAKGLPLGADGFEGSYYKKE